MKINDFDISTIKVAVFDYDDTCELLTNIQNKRKTPITSPNMMTSLTMIGS